MEFEYRDRAQLRQEALDEIKNKTIPEELKQCVGENHEERWVCTSSKFRPLRDILALSRHAPTQKFYERLRQNKETQQFILAPELALETTKLAKQLAKDYELVKRLLPKVMPPYPSVCVEMPITEQVQSLRNPALPGEFFMRRVGAYITTTDDGDAGVTFTFTPYYESIDGSVAVAPVMLVHNSKNDTPAMGLPVLMSNFNMRWVATLHPDEWVAVAKQNIPFEKLRDVFAGAVFRAAANETVDEIPTLFFAWLVLINSKSGITPTKIEGKLPPATLSKRQRRKRERSAYTVLCLSDLEQSDTAGVVTPRSAVSAHRVRGHFKARKRGVFWWRPHVRGVGDVVEREAYKVNS